MSIQQLVRTTQGILCGLPKHKENIPARPVMSVRKTPLYIFFQSPIQFTEKFTNNEYAVL